MASSARNAGFGATDEFDGLLGGDGEGERVGVGQDEVFAGEDDDAAKVNCWLTPLP
jgi:hypothetical protein